MSDTSPATRPVPTARGADRRTPAPRRHHEAMLHYAREALVAAALSAAEADEDDEVTTQVALIRAASAYRAAESADLGPG